MKININQKSPTVKQNLQENFNKTNVKSYFLDIPVHKRRVFGALIDLNNRFQDIFASQMNLAVKAGIRRETANRYLKEFEKLGLIETRQYRHRETLHYHIPPLFHEREFRDELAKIPGLMKCFMVLSIWFLLAPDPIFSKSRNPDKLPLITQTNISLSIKNSYIKSEPLSREEQARIQREKMIAQLTPEQMDRLNALRREKNRGNQLNPHLMRTAKNASTLADVFKTFGFDAGEGEA